MIFHPLLAPFFNTATYAVVRRMLSLRPINPSLAKFEGMLRFYLEGKRMVTEQNWPECLGERKMELCEALGFSD